MICSLFPENRDFLDQLPLNWRTFRAIAPATVNVEFQVLGSSIAVVVKNLNFIIVI